MNNSGCSKAAKCPPRGMVVQCVMVYAASHQLRGALRISLGKLATPVGTSTLAPPPKEVKLSHYNRAEDTAELVAQYIITLSRSSSLDKIFSG